MNTIKVRSCNVRKTSLEKITLFFSIVASILAVSIPSRAADESIGIITSVQGGGAFIKRPGTDNLHVLKKGDVVFIGDDITSGKQSAVQLTFTDDSFVNLLPDSMLRVNQYSFEPDQNRRTAHVRMLTGKARFVLFKARNKESAFFVETDTALIVAGTPGDFAVKAATAETEVMALNRPVYAKHISHLIVGDMSVDVNQKTIIGKKIPPVRPLPLTREERKSYLREIR